ncbi:hypothetical protein [Clostridium manihotivorum]|uniref:Histidine kinase n=1 Tax=Clostridium manihotivorum TaxID=2320868 RepID=A0A3R5QSM1_9CLOT|nr:hypothetical protein [Clostridium manihotivorum]QAA31389.1 hypothetical protein C1I91_06880 [Clostridium manihotivorum]
MIHINTKNLTSKLYLLGILILVIPMLIASITENGFSSISTKIFLSTSFTLILIGKILSTIKRKKANENIAIDIGLILGILTTIISNLIR